MTTHTRTTISLTLALASGILTAYARTESTQDVPISVSALSGSEITRSGITDIATIRDLATHVPITARNPDTLRSTSTLFIRGLGAIPSTNNDIIMPPEGLKDISRIEVLRGPQGTLFGRNAQAGVINIVGSVGHVENTTYDPNNDHSSSYVSAGINYSNKFDLAGGKLNLSAGLAYTYYDDAFENRDGNDSYLHDFYTQFVYNKELSPSAQLEINVNLNYGEHSTVASGAILVGALQMPLFNFNTDAEVTWRTDGAGIDDAGLLHRTGIHLGGYRESGGDFADSTRYSLSHELIWQKPEDRGHYARFEIGARDWKEMIDYDSTRITAVGGVYGILPCGAQFRAGGGLEWRQYDGNNLDDRTVPTFEAVILGNVGNVDYSIGARYGIFDKFANWGGGNGVDMEGLEIGARFKVPLSERLTLGMALESSYLKAESSSYAQGHVHYLHGGLLLNYQLNDHTSLRLNSSLDRVNINSGFNSATEIYNSWSVSVRRDF